MITKRQNLRSIMTYISNFARLWDYVEERPMTLTKITLPQLHNKMAAGEHVKSDCSESVTAVCKWAGLKDPNGRNYDNTGNSETMLAFLRNYRDARLARTGAIVHFQNPDHVAFVYKPDPIFGNPTLWEHGAPGIAIVKLSVEKQFHSGPVVFLSIGKLL